MIIIVIMRSTLFTYGRVLFHCGLQRNTTEAIGRTSP